MRSARRFVLDLDRREFRNTPFEFFCALRFHAMQPAAIVMRAGHERELMAHCPNAAIVFDPFHVAAKYGREVVDRVRSIRRTSCVPIAVAGT